MSTEPTIVIVGINMDDRDSIFRTLDAESYRIIVAENPDDAEQQVEHERVDMVIGDLQSTSFDALEFLRSWKARHADTAFVFVTIDRDVTSAVESMKLGASDCLIKPVDPEELRMLVAKLLDARNADGVDHEPGSRGSRRDFNIPPGTSLEDLQRAAVEQALAQHHGNRTHAAKTLGISVRTLQRKLKAWGMPLAATPFQQAHHHFLLSSHSTPSAFSAHAH